MSYGIGPINSQSAYLPTEFDIPDDDKIARELITQRNRQISSSVNIREISIYETQEALNGQQWFNNGTSQQSRQPRYGYRKVFDMVSLNGANIPVSTTSSFAHNISGIVTPTRIYGTATTSTGKFIPLPNVSVSSGNNDIEIYATATNIVVVTGSKIDDGSGNTLTQCYAILEYTKI